jgi:hypothetical protein
MQAGILLAPTVFCSRYFSQIGFRTGIYENCQSRNGFLVAPNTRLTQQSILSNYLVVAALVCLPARDRAPARLRRLQSEYLLGVRSRIHRPPAIRPLHARRPLSPESSHVLALLCVGCLRLCHRQNPHLLSSAILFSFFLICTQTTVECRSLHRPTPTFDIESSRVESSPIRPRPREQ